MKESGPPGGYGTNVVDSSTFPAVNFPGLDQLSNLDGISIRKKGGCGCCECWPGNSKFKVKSDEGQVLYRVQENTNCLLRFVCGLVRPFQIHVMDSLRSEVMEFKRSCGCGLCLGCCGNWFLPCFLQEMDVSWPPGQLLGRIRQNYSPCTPSLTILDSFGQPKFHIRGGCWRFPYFVNIQFKILSSDNQMEIGSITKKWTSCCNEKCLDARRFDVRFPQDVDARDKALVLSAAILIHYMHFA